jgi:hypothetical protein
MQAPAPPAAQAAPLIQTQTANTAPVSVPPTGAGLTGADSGTADTGVVNKKMNLEDIAVKGELLGDDRMSFVRRQREELKNRIKFRTNFRNEILQEYKQ